MNDIFKIVIEWLSGHGLRVCFILVFAFLLIIFSRFVSSRLIGLVLKHRKGRDEEFDKQMASLRSILNFVFMIMIGVFAGVRLLSELGLNIEGVIAHILKIIAIVAIAYILIKLSRIVSSRVFGTVVKHQKKQDVEFEKRAETLRSILHFVFSILIGIVAGVSLLSEFGVEIGPILAAAGVLGLAVGFGAQSLVKDIIGGFFIFLEDQIRVGDVVEVAGKAGVVENMNLRITTLRDLSGNVHFVPNGEISVVTNMTKGFSRYVFDIGVAYREDVDEVMDVMQEVDKDMRNDPDFGGDIIEPLEILGLDQFGDSALIIKARTTTKPIKQWRVAREFNRRLKKAFDVRDIEIPFPHQTLYIGQDKQGKSPALNLIVEEQSERSKRS